MGSTIEEFFLLDERAHWALKKINQGIHILNVHGQHTTMDIEGLECVAIPVEEYQSLYNNISDAGVALRGTLKSMDRPS